MADDMSLIVITWKFVPDQINQTFYFLNVRVERSCYRARFKERTRKPTKENYNNLVFWVLMYKTGENTEDRK